MLTTGRERHATQVSRLAFGQLKMLELGLSLMGGCCGSALAVVVAIILALFIRTFVVQAFKIPTGSMETNLLIGDHLLVNKLVYAPAAAPLERALLARKPIRRGHVVVFKFPEEPTRDFIKRVIGLPGDTVQMQNGRLYINGEEVPQVADGYFVERFAPQGPLQTFPSCVQGRVPEGADCTKEKAIETLPGGRAHSVLNVFDGRFDNTGVFSVPEGHYFFMGDNRDNSTDSRERQDFGGVGFVPYDYLIGRADRVIFSSAGRSLLFVWTWRPDRFFKKIQ